MSASYAAPSGNTRYLNPTVEPTASLFLDVLTRQSGQPIDTSQFAPQVAGQSLLQQQAQQVGATGAGLGTLQRDATGRITGFTGGTGIASYEPYLQQAETMAAPSAATIQGLMSPYQQNVLDTTLAEINRSYDQQGIQQAAKAGQQFGGSRYGVQTAELQRNRAQQIADTTARLSQSGYESALNRAQNQFANQMTLAQNVPTLQAGQIQNLGLLGQDELAYQQSILEAGRKGSEMAAFEPQQRLGFFGEQLTGIMGGVPSPQRQTGAPPLSPTMAGIGTMTGLLGLTKGAAGGS